MELAVASVNESFFQCMKMVDELKMENNKNFEQNNITCFECEECDGNGNTAVIRANAMASKNNRHEVSAMKKIKQCGQEAESTSAAVGAVVSLKVDYQTHSDANGLIAIVYAVRNLSVL